MKIKSLVHGRLEPINRGLKVQYSPDEKRSLFIAKRKVHAYPKSYVHPTRVPNFQRKRISQPTANQSVIRRGRDMTQVTLDLLRELIRDDYPDVVLQEFEGAPGSNRGDNYTSMVYRITLKGIFKQIDPDGSSETEQPWSGSLIYKCLPECLSRREAYKSDELFCNEVAFYTTIWPAMEAFQSKWNVDPFKAIPKCYLARNDCVILRDLKQYGFKMPDRTQGLSVAECYMVLQQLSQFHALSMAMKIQDPDKFFELINEKNGINEVFFIENNLDYYRKYYQEAIQNALAMVEEELKDSDMRDHYLDKFRRFCTEDTFFQMMVDMVKPVEPGAVVSHGDCWTNNFLFRYEGDNVAEMRIVDFQMVRYASPALDLVYVLYLCIDREQRRHHLDSLLQTYIDELHARVQAMTDRGTLSKEELGGMIREEFKRCSLFGLGIGLDMLPILTCDSDEAPNVYQAEESGESSREVEPPVPVWTTNSACRKKMTDLVQELVDQNLL